MKLERGSVIFVELVDSQMLALLIDARLQGGNLCLCYPLGGEPRRHPLQCLARDINLDRTLGIVLYQIDTQTRNDLDNAFGLKTVDCAPQRRAADAKLAAELFHADLIAGTVAVSAEKKGAHKRIGVTAEARAPQFLHWFLPCSAIHDLVGRETRHGLRRQLRSWHARASILRSIDSRDHVGDARELLTRLAAGLPAIALGEIDALPIRI